MSGQTPEQEPSIEEILASIRQIISDDDEGTPVEAAEAEAEAEEEAKPEPVAAEKPAAVTPPAPKAEKEDDDVLELKDPLPPPMPRPVIDMEDALEEEDEEEFSASLEEEERAEVIIARPPEEPEDDAGRPAPFVATAQPETKKEPRPSPDAGEESILGETARMAALSGFSKLANTMPLERGTTPQHDAGGTTLEDILRDMLNPMLREWLDANLPVIIEKLVQKELDKLARRASDD